MARADRGVSAIPRPTGRTSFNRGGGALSASPPRHDLIGPVTVCAGVARDASLEIVRPASAREDLQVREIEVDRALVPDPLPDVPYSFNPYVGCAHGCSFCYVPRLRREDRWGWGTYVQVKRNAPNVLAREVRRLPRGLVMISTATDPYQYVEGHFRITRHALEVLLRADWPISVLTRSALVTRDIDLFQEFREAEVGFSVPTIDDQARAVLEPHAPSIASRLRALRALSDAGIATFVSLSPAYQPTAFTSADVAEAFAAAGVRRVFSRLLDARGGAREVMLEHLESTELASLYRMSDRRAMAAYVESVAEACRARGMEFAALRY